MRGMKSGAPSTSLSARAVPIFQRLRVGLPTASSERNASCRLGVPCDILRRTNH